MPVEVSAPLRSPNGFHLLKLTNKRGGNSPLVIQQTHARHILIKITEVMSDKEAQAKIERIVSIEKQLADDGRWLEELNAKAEGA